MPTHWSQIMKTLAGLVLLAGLLSFVPLFAQDTYPIKTYDLAASTYKGEQVRGPKTIKATNISALRYDYSWDSSVTFVAGSGYVVGVFHGPNPGSAQGGEGDYSGREMHARHP